MQVEVRGDEMRGVNCRIVEERERREREREQVRGERGEERER